MRFTLNREDAKKWLKNTLIFAGPALLVLLASTADILPKESWWGVVVLYLVNVATDLLRKYIAENK